MELCTKDALSADPEAFLSQSTSYLGKKHHYRTQTINKVMQMPFQQSARRQHDKKKKHWFSKMRSQHSLTK